LDLKKINVTLFPTGHSPLFRPHGFFSNFQKLIQKKKKCAAGLKLIPTHEAKPSKNGGKFELPLSLAFCMTVLLNGFFIHL